MVALRRAKAGNGASPRRRIRYASGDLAYLVAANMGPPLLGRLPGREQEIAMIVYLRGEATARDVEFALSTELTNSAIRSMLTRLVAKGVLRRRKESNRFVYLPGISDDKAQEKALAQVTRDYFGSSYFRAALAMVDLLDKCQPEAMATFFDEVMTERGGAPRASHLNRAAG